jgi:hypothetical protein
MNQHIGIVKGKAGWIQILEQEGLFYKPFEKGDEPAVLIVDEYAGEPAVKEYLHEGGSVLTDVKTLARIDERSAKRITIKHIVPDSSDFLKNVDIIDIFSTGYRVMENGFGKINDKLPAIVCLPKGRGTIIGIPFDVSSSMLDPRSRMKFFYHANGKFPAEHVSTVSKGEVRKLVVNTIRYLFKRQRLYYVHKWYYPEGKRNAFTFRIDTDTPVIAEIMDCFRIAEKHKLLFTFFIFTWPIEESLKELRAMTNQEIAVHCYEHKPFRNPEKLFNNFNTARNQLRNTGFDISGLAVPYGSWSKLIGEVTEELGFLYASDFSFSYDDLPSYPLLDEGFSRVLQIPVHPITPASLLYVKNDAASITTYYCDLINRKLSNDDPLFFYGHSSVIAHAPGILEDIIAAIKESGNIWTGSYRQFYDWWKQRESTGFSHSVKQSRLQFESVPDSPRNFIRIISPGDDETIVPMEASIDLKKIAFKEEKYPELFDRRRLGTKHGQLKLKLKEIENWIKR